MDVIINYSNKYTILQCGEMRFIASKDCGRLEPTETAYAHVQDIVEVELIDPAIVGYSLMIGKQLIIC